MKNKNGNVRVSFSSVNEKIFFSKEAGCINTMTKNTTVMGRFTRAVGRVSRALSYTSTRTYGAFMLSFGFLSLVLHLAKYFIYPEFEVKLISLIVGVVFSALSIPLLLSDKPMCIALQDNSLTDYVIFEFFAIKRMHRINNDTTVPPIIAVFLGLIPAGMSFVFNTEDIAFVMLSILVVTLSFVSPEFPLILTTISIPYLSLFDSYEVFIFVMSLVSFLSYAIKVVVGKRVYSFEIYDVLVIGFIGATIMSGALAGSLSLEHSMIYASLTLSYFTASNLLINRRLADLAINAIIVSSVPVSIFSILNFFLELWNKSFFEFDRGFGESTSFVMYITVSALFTLGFVIQKNSRWKKLVYFAIFVVELFAMGLTVHPGIPFVLVGVFIAYAIINMRKFPTDFLLLFIGALYSAVAIFPDLAEKLLHKIGFYANILPGSFDEAILTFKENLVFGVGIDTGREIGRFNLFTFLISSVGALGFALFVLLIVVRMRHFSYYRVYVRNSILNVDCNISFISLFALLMLGAETSILSVSSDYLFFFIVFGIGSATLRASKKAYDDLLGYYKDQRSAETAAVDVLLR